MTFEEIKKSLSLIENPVDKLELEKIWNPFRLMRNAVKFWDVLRLLKSVTRGINFMAWQILRWCAE